MPYPGVPEHLTGKMESCVEKVMREQGVDKSGAIAICHDSVMGKEVEAVMKEDAMSDCEDCYPSSEEGLDEKAKWTTAYINSLPNSSFLFVEPGCDNKGCRHLPFKDASGKVDLPHVRNALSRLGSSSNVPSLTGSKRQSVINRAKKLLGDDKEKSDEEKEDGLVNKTIKKLAEIIMSNVKEVTEPTSLPTEMGGDFMLFKEADGTYRWLARYSNNLRDDDIPQEIISAKSHQRFVEMVDSGEYPMPTLQIWHVKDWTFGEADWVAWDDVGNDMGFSVASGKVYPQHNELAEAIMNLPSGKVKMSHGMPYSSIVRDPDDDTIIIEHQTKEISILPAWAAANKFTGFVLITPDNGNVKEEPMSIPDSKKATLQEEWSLGAELLPLVEQADVKDAAQAQEEEIESKEKEETPQETPQEEAKEVEAAEAVEAPAAEATEEVPSDLPEETPQETPEETPEETPKEISNEKEAEGDPQPPENPLTREEVKDGILAAFNPLIEAQNGLVGQIEELTKQVSTLTKQVDELSKSDDEKMTDLLKHTPAASIPDLVIKSVIGRPEARVDGRTTLGKDGPKETPHAEEKPSVTGVSHLDYMLREGVEQ